MKILTRSQFLQMPSGTIYAKGEPWALNCWAVRLDTCEPDDWFYDELDWSAIDCAGSNDLVDKVEDSLANGTSYPMDFHQTGRDGGHSVRDVFAVLEPDDIRTLIARLQECLGSVP